MFLSSESEPIISLIFRGTVTCNTSAIDAGADDGSGGRDGRLLTLDDTVEFFNLVPELKLCAAEKEDLVAYLRCLRRGVQGRSSS